MTTPQTDGQGRYRHGSCGLAGPSLTRLGVAILVGIASACGLEEPVAPGPDLRLGVIQYEDLISVQWSVPEAGRVGGEITVTVNTLSIRCEEKGEVRITVAGRNVRIEPFDIPARDVSACSARIDPLHHEARFRILEPGRVRVRLIGFRFPGFDVIAVDRTMEIR